MQTYTSGIGTLFMSMSIVLNPRLVLVLVQKILFPKHEVGDESEWMWFLSSPLARPTTGLFCFFCM